MLPKSRKPEILRLHSLESIERQRFISNYFTTLIDLFPNAFKYQIFTNPMLKTLIPDLYFTYVTICLCRKRLGQQYTYVSMCKDQHYQQQGVLVNRKYRILVFLLQIFGRNILTNLLEKIQKKINSKIKIKEIKAILKCTGNSSQILANIQWFLIMLFMLNITKSPNFIDIKLGLGYIYTFFNEKQTNISYKIQGLLLLSVFLIKFVNFFINLRSELKFQTDIQHQQQKSLNKIQMQEQNNQEKQNIQTCKICYGQIEEKSCTKCGHIFCWNCIIKSLQYNSQCPVCRTKCLPRQVIQLLNY